jgi:hypothetical protein
MMNNIIIGVLFLFFILYNRLWRLRIPQNFTDMANSPYYLLYLLIIISFILALLISLYQIYVKLLKTNERPNFITKRLGMIMNHKYNPLNILSMGMIELDAFIKNNTPYYDDTHSYSDIIIMKIAYFLFCTKIRTIIVIIFLRLIPQMIVCISFLLDIWFHDKFVYFYKTLILLIIPLIIQYIQYSIENYINTNLQGLDDILIIRILPLHLYYKDISLEYYDIISIYQKRDILLSQEGVNYIFNNNLSEEALKSFNGDIISAQASLEKAIDIMNKLFNLNSLLHTFKENKVIIETPFQIFKYTVYIMGWLHILDYIT